MAPLPSNNGLSTDSHEERVVTEKDIFQNHVSLRGRSVMTLDNAFSSLVNLERSRTSPLLRNAEGYSTSSFVNRSPLIVWKEPVGANSLDISRGVDISLLSQREAFLLRSYIGILAPWVSCTMTAKRHI